MIHYQILYWRDIPAQVKIYTKRRPTSHALSSRFQVAIDRIAMEEGLTGTEAYLDQWQWSEKKPIEGDPSEIAARIIEQVEREGDEQLAAYRKRSCARLINAMTSS